MNKILVFLFFFGLFLILSCRRFGNEKVNVSIYYNPSGTFFADSQHLEVAISNEVIVDTLFDKNTYVDKSRLIRCLKINENDLRYISIKVNDIDTILENNEKIKKCVAFFISYSDHEGLFNEINKRNLDMTGNAEKFNRTLDSLNNALGKNLRRVEVKIIPDYCD